MWGKGEYMGTESFLFSTTEIFCSLLWTFVNTEKDKKEKFSFHTWEKMIATDILFVLNFTHIWLNNWHIA